MKKLSAMALSSALFLSGCASVHRSNQNTASVIFDPQPMVTNIQYDRMDSGGTLQMGSRGLSADQARSVDWTSQGTVDLKSEDSSSNRNKTTLMVYMVGSDLESEAGLASMDLIEMQESGLVNENVDLVILAGGTTSWNINMSSDALHLMHYDPDKGIMFNDTELQDMSSPDTLHSFLEYCASNYPADQTGLIFWDHGGGPLFGYGNDELSDEMMPMYGLVAALEASPYKDKGLDFIAFDACIMGSLEVATELEPYTDRLVVSAENVPGYGMNYSYLSALNSTDDLGTLTRSMIDSTADFYSELNSQAIGQGMDLVFCEYDLTKVDALNQATGELFAAAAEHQKQNPLFWKKLYQSRDRSLEYSGGQVDLTDLGDLTTYTMEYLPEESVKVQDCLRDVVVYGRSNMMDSTGVNIYFPHSQPKIYQYARTLLDGTSQYSWFQDGYCRELLDFIDDNPGMLNPDRYDRAGFGNANILTSDFGTDGHIILPVDLEDQVLSASMTIYMTSERGNVDDKEYLPVMENLPVDIRDGELVYDPDPVVVVYETGNKDYSLLRFRFLRQEEESGVYQSVNTSAQTDAYHMFYGERQNCIVQVQAANDGSSARVTSFYASQPDEDEQEGVAGKNDMDMTDFLAVNFNTIPGEYLIDTSLPPAQQPESENYFLSTIEYEESGQITAKKVSELEDAELYYQIVLTDTNQGASVFAFEPFDDEEAEMTSIQTKTGTMEFLLTDDTATLVRYDGNDKKVVVPETVEGKTVTVIGSGAFRQPDLVAEDGARVHLEEVVLPETIEVIGDLAFESASSLKTINLPDSLKRIADQAFANTSLRQIDLPDHLEFIGSYAFSEIRDFLDQFSLEIVLPDSLQEMGDGVFTGTGLSSLKAGEKNQVVKVQDGLLLSKDGKTVYGWAGPVQNELKIPDGVERIARSAFEGSTHTISGIMTQARLKKVTLPETLQVIDIYAFFGDESIEEMNLPDSLVRIAPMAFGQTLSSNYVSNLKLTLPANLSSIGYGALGAFQNLELSVAEDNPFFSVKDGKLMNKAGDKEIPALYQEKTN